MAEADINLDRPPLTGRERDVLEYVARGMSTKQIAQHLNLSPGTVGRYIENVRHKLGARNKTHLIAQAVAAGRLKLK